MNQKIILTLHVFNFCFRLFSKRNKPAHSPPTAAFIANPSLLNDNAPSSWSHFSELTEQINNYQQEYSEINWQERCLELQLELHRSRNQAGRIRDMLKEKVCLHTFSSFLKFYLFFVFSKGSGLGKETN